MKSNVLAVSVRDKRESPGAGPPQWPSGQAFAWRAGFAPHFQWPCHCCFLKISIVVAVSVREKRESQGAGPPQQPDGKTSARRAADRASFPAFSGPVIPVS